MARKRPNPGTVVDDKTATLIREAAAALQEFDNVFGLDDTPGGVNDMATPIDDRLAADNATNDKVLAVDVPAVYAWKQFERQEERLAALEAALAQQNQQLFGTLQSERQQLFANTQVLFQAAWPTVAQAWANAGIVSTKTLDKDTNEINSEAIGGEVVAGLAPEIRQAIDAAVAKNVNATNTIDIATLSELLKALVAAPKPA